ncbi:MAG: hypothetical protein WEC15_01580 [Flavobacteriales bacterium]
MANEGRTVLRWLSFFIAISAVQVLCAQVFTNKMVGKKHAERIDSLKAAPYPFSLPIWGAKATAAGYELPYSAGLSVNYLWQRSDLVIDNLQVGFNNGPTYALDGLVRFNKAEATTQSITLRPDVWLLPFLNVYGVFGKASASTDVGFGIWIPDSTNTDKEIFSAGSKVDFDATTVGFGLTPTMGVAGGFLALDMNMSWTDVPQLDRPTFAFIFGPRMGKTFKFQKERALTVWTGGFRVALNSNTSGDIALNEVLPVDQWGSGIDAANARVDDAQQQVDAWWSSLTPLQQNNPVNAAKYDGANAALAAAGQFVNAAEGAANNAASSTVQYTMDKRPADKWNFIVGGQFQLNKHLMIRAEYGFLASRTQFMTGLQYRFGL